MIDIRTVAMLLPIASFMVFLFFAYLAFESNKTYKGMWTLTFSYLFAFISNASVFLRDFDLMNIEYLVTNVFGFIAMFLFYLGIYHYLNERRAKRRFGVPFTTLAIVASTYYVFVYDIYYIRVVIWSVYMIVYLLFTYIEFRRAQLRDTNRYAYYPMLLVLALQMMIAVGRAVNAVYSKEYVTLDSVNSIEAMVILGAIFLNIAVALSFVIVMNRRTIRRLELANIETNKRYYEAIVISETDFLTGLPNRKKLDETLLSFIKLARKSKFGFSAILIDIDHFKHINDTFGHLQGDRVLKTVSNMLKRNFSEPVVYGRWGGDEFLVLLPNMRYSTANEIRKSIVSAVSDYQIKGFSISVSIGIIQFKKAMTEAQFFVELDKDLYKNKKDS